MAVSHFSPQFQISARAETSHVIATKFQPGLSRHVIGPLIRTLRRVPLMSALTGFHCRMIGSCQLGYGLELDQSERKSLQVVARVLKDTFTLNRTGTNPNRTGEDRLLFTWNRRI